MDFFFKAVMSLDDVSKCYDFFQDVCTISELKAMVQRFQVARMLMDKKTYNEIADETGASSATISRVNRSLQYGDDGYRYVFEKMTDQEED